jgi:hypothetical protein
MATINIVTEILRMWMGSVYMGIKRIKVCDKQMLEFVQLHYFSQQSSSLSSGLMCTQLFSL